MTCALLTFGYKVCRMRMHQKLRINRSLLNKLFWEISSHKDKHITGVFTLIRNL